MFLVLSPKQLINRAKKFLIPNLITSLEDSDREERFFQINPLIYDPIRLRNIVKLIKQIFIEILTSYRPHLVTSIHWVAYFHLSQFVDQTCSKFIIMAFMDYESLG